MCYNSIMRKLIVGNWKMNPISSTDAVKLLKGISTSSKLIKDVDVALCVPSIYLPILTKLPQKKVMIGAQNTFFEESGAYTGEISFSMLKNLKAKFSIVGHSERRAMGETNEDCNKKILSLIKSGITPILCVGEKERLQDASYLVVVRTQLMECLLNVPKSKIKDIVIAYEPVWAIGKDAIRETTPEESMEMALYIKKTLADIAGPSVAHSVRVLYGGSVNTKNCEIFMAHGGVDGLLVGRESLDPKKFTFIIKSASTK